jgi:hypothetical protein
MDGAALSVGQYVMSVQPYDATRRGLETLIGDWTLWRFACVQEDAREEREGAYGRKRGSFMPKFKVRKARLEINTP